MRRKTSRQILQRYFNKPKYSPQGSENQIKQATMLLLYGIKIKYVVSEVDKKRVLVIPATISLTNDRKKIIIT